MVSVATILAPVKHKTAIKAAGYAAAFGYGLRRKDDMTKAEMKMKTITVARYRQHGLALSKIHCYDGDPAHSVPVAELYDGAEITYMGPDISQVLNGVVDYPAIFAAQGLTPARIRELADGNGVMTDADRAANTQAAKETDRLRGELGRTQWRAEVLASCGQSTWFGALRDNPRLIERCRRITELLSYNADMTNPGADPENETEEVVIARKQELAALLADERNNPDCKGTY